MAEARKAEARKAEARKLRYVLVYVAGVRILGWKLVDPVM